jgi:hypothetical protein
MTRIFSGYTPSALLLLSTLAAIDLAGVLSIGIGRK